MFETGYQDAIAELNKLSNFMRSRSSVLAMKKAANDSIQLYRSERAGKFFRPGVKDTMAVEDRFYFGKGRKERFA